MTTSTLKLSDYIELIIIIVIILIVRLSILEPFRVPSGSMKPNLLIGDFVFTNKFIYSVQLPLINIVTKKPTKGDIVMFKKDKIKYVKRVISIPYEIINYKNKQISINNITVKKKIKTIKHAKKNKKLYTITEYLTPQATYIIKNKISKNKSYDFIHSIIKKKHYFMMGDNRDNSEDCRDFNSIKYKAIKGKVIKVWLSIDIKNIDIRWNRLFKTIT